MTWILAGALLVFLGGGCVYLGKQRNALKAHIEAIETTPAAQVQPGGPVELSGVAECAHPLQPPYGGSPCVYYSYKKERWERKSAGLSFDANDRDRDEYEWKTIESDTKKTVFALRDSSGTISVNPEGAEIEAPVIFSGDVDASPPAGQGILGQIGSALSALSQQRVRVETRGLAVGIPLYVLGNASRNAAGQVQVGSGESKFLISYKSESEVKSGLAAASTVLYIVGGLLIVLGVAALIAAASGAGA
jgi:hypothetical protein